MARGPRYAGQAHLLFGGSRKDAGGTLHVLSAVVSFCPLWECLLWVVWEVGTRVYKNWVPV